MNKSELIDAVAKSAGVTKQDAEKCLSAFSSVVIETLGSGEKVQWAGFGTFELRHREARQGINPATGEKIRIAACDSPAFKPGKALKDSFK